jgi:peptide/nickel transport system permease protein
MRYALRKILTMLITMLVVSFVVFFAFHLVSGDPASSKLGTDATPERLAALRAEMGLDAPLPVRYLRWLYSFAGGDMGQSYSYNMAVSTMVADKIPITITLTMMAFALIVVIAIPLGISAAKLERRPAGRLVMTANQIVMAIPPFFLGIILTIIFGMVFKVFTPGGYISYKVDLGRFLAYLFFPALAIALPKAAMAVKLLRGAALTEVRADYVRTAYGKGGSTNLVLYRHVLKNAAIPLVTFLGMALADMMVGSIIIEQVFGIPGLGRILIASITNRDYPVVMAIMALLTFLVLIVNMLVDLLYGALDPRIRQKR